jgi:hypothetical protein
LKIVHLFYKISSKETSPLRLFVFLFSGSAADVFRHVINLFVGQNILVRFLPWQPTFPRPTLPYIRFSLPQGQDQGRALPRECYLARAVGNSGTDGEVISSPIMKRLFLASLSSLCGGHPFISRISGATWGAGWWDGGGGDTHVLILPIV